MMLLLVMSGQWNGCKLPSRKSKPGIPDPTEHVRATKAHASKPTTTMEPNSLTNDSTSLGWSSWYIDQNNTGGALLQLRHEDTARRASIAHRVAEVQMSKGWMLTTVVVRPRSRRALAGSASTVSVPSQSQRLPAPFSA